MGGQGHRQTDLSSSLWVRARQTLPQRLKRRGRFVEPFLGEGPADPAQPLTPRLVSGVISLAPCLCDVNQRRASVLWGLDPLNKALRRQCVDDPLDGLPAHTRLPGQLRDRGVLLRSGDRTQNLPTGAGEPETADNAIACSQQSPIQTKDLEDEVANVVDVRLHLTGSLEFDNVLSIFTAAVSFDQQEKMMTHTAVYRIDKFIVPLQSKARFLERLRTTHDRLDQVEGCDRNLLLEQVDGEGRFNVITFVQWRNAACYGAAREQSQAAQAATGFDPAVFMQELGVIADLADYQALLR